MTSQTYDSLNKAWKGTCRVIFGREIGELSEFDEWLNSYMITPHVEKSGVSGKPVALPCSDYKKHDYAKGARFASFDEISFGKKFEPLNVNEIKDIDGIIGAIGERIVYSGNIVLGNSSYVEGSADVINSSFVSSSSMVADSKYISHSVWVQEGQYCFGNLGNWKNAHSVMVSGGEYTRCFECHSGEVNSDCYYCGSPKDSTNCMFSFGIQNRRYLIGNVELPREKYLGIKKALIEQIAGTLEKDKEIFSLFDILEGCQKYGHEDLGVNDEEKEKKFDIAPIEKAFGATTGILFGKPLSGGIDSYSKFLQRHVPVNVHLKSPFSGKDVALASYRAFLSGLYKIDGRMVTESEVRQIGKIQGEIGKIEKMRASLDSVCETLHEIAYSDLDKQYGNITNVLDGTVVIDAHDCYRGSAYSHCKKCAYCFWPLNSEHVFGSYDAWGSQFCVNCYNSKRLARCLEVDCSHDCADSYFLHNCENVNDSMFCFNAKNLKRAIGNAELEAGKYASVKGAVIEQIRNELEKKKDLKWDIYGLGKSRARD